jgi:hypothetical protein
MVSPNGREVPRVQTSPSGRVRRALYCRRRCSPAPGGRREPGMDIGRDAPDGPRGRRNIDASVSMHIGEWQSERPALG